VLSRISSRLRNSLLIVVLCLGWFGVGILVAHPTAIANILAIAERDKIAFVFMDVWEAPPSDLWLPEQRALYEPWWENLVRPYMQNNVVPFLQVLRDRQAIIIFSNNGLPLATTVQQEMYFEPVISRTADLDAYLKGFDIDAIAYVGFATNACILTRPTGIQTMHALGYDIILVKDASLEAPSLKDYIRTLEEALIEINSYGKVLTTKEVLKLIP